MGWKRDKRQGDLNRPTNPIGDGLVSIKFTGHKLLHLFGGESWLGILAALENIEDCLFSRGDLQLREHKVCDGAYNKHP